MFLSGRTFMLLKLYCLLFEAFQEPGEGMLLEPQSHIIWSETMVRTGPRTPHGQGRTAEGL